MYAVCIWFWPTLHICTRTYTRSTSPKTHHTQHEPVVPHLNPANATSKDTMPKMLPAPAPAPAPPPPPEASRTHCAAHTPARPKDCNWCRPERRGKRGGGRGTDRPVCRWCVCTCTYVSVRACACGYVYLFVFM